jgi:signal transduction histidine kinase
VTSKFDDCDCYLAELSELKQEFSSLIHTILDHSQSLSAECPSQQAMILDKIIQANQQLLADVEQQLTPAVDGAPELASQIRHDLRSRLTVVLGYTEILLEEESATPQQPSRLTSIFATAQQILALTDKILPALFV